MPTSWGGPPVTAPEPGEIGAARQRTAGLALRTPVLPLADAPGFFIKVETLQPTGSFKIRGVLNWALSLPAGDRSRGFSTFSAGNTALALGFAARMLGVKCSSLLPDYAPAAKVAALEALGVTVRSVPFSRMTDWLFSAGWRSEPQAFLHPWAEPLMIAGHGVIGLELLEDLPDLNTVYVPVGGGALAAGVGSVLKARCPGVRVVGVQSAAYPALAQSRQRGKPSWIVAAPTICDGVAVPFASSELFGLLGRVLDDVVLVDDAEVRRTIRRLALSEKLVAEGAGAISVAAALRSGQDLSGQAAAIVSGGNIDPGLLASILQEAP